ncbi:hypothetical protein JZM24_17435 [Candidatus Sodalis endolongispinus]|uniref:Uncharacterized protein n=1 Tax=Candidatus Sodalis endolongispinus TaxID=2812662 RepID=A0ABS5YEQ9_9GAMM|nr:hypothetical protein [Candidatus Sodalis endolongispinus]MBT9433428.1 hypothetical protein [Candidatus Sodalis endolongispinus]
MGQYNILYKSLLAESSFLIVEGKNNNLVDLLPMEEITQTLHDLRTFVPNLNEHVPVPTNHKEKGPYQPAQLIT